MQVKNLKEILTLPEMDHILTFVECSRITQKLEQIGARQSERILIYEAEGKTILDAAKLLIGTNTTLISRVVLLILNALWPERFELLMDK